MHTRTSDESSRTMHVHENFGGIENDAPARELRTNHRERRTCTRTSDESSRTTHVHENFGGIENDARARELRTNHRERRTCMRTLTETRLTHARISLTMKWMYFNENM
ncbi:hypothetical protein PoB_001148500 [Plakobranchus ocellatus]|uniref:Uncharacterized protein n=1 Tax=Plakobranchus ocellatus TaxID=259542 RepID=A0AAV3YPB6_9GAST|nr:hypothetical protein PoB_001148500 [Plakobranchus ocellatus]